MVSDFDGTLSPIVTDPWGAEILGLARTAIRALAGTPGVEVAMLSGRTAADVASRVRVGGVRYLGNHGLERGRLLRRQRPGTIEVAIHPAFGRFGPLAEMLATSMPRAVSEDWLVVERKGPAIAFHYRTAPDVHRAADLVRRAVDVLDPDGTFVRFPGRRVLELRPPGATAKGEALRQLIDEIRPAAALILGDDVSDALAFAVLRAAREAGELEGLAVAVQAHAEAPPEVAAAADVVFASPRDAAAFLAALSRTVSRSARAPVGPGQSSGSGGSKRRTVSRS